MDGPDETATELGEAGPGSAPEVVVETHGLTKHYGPVAALVDLSLKIRAGRVFGFIGPNGAGKTTTIRILAGLLLPTSGRATIAGADCSRDLARIKQLVGYLPDAFGVYDEMRVWEYLDFFGAAYRIPKRQRRERIDEVMEITHSAYMRDRFVDALSRGMKQRVGLARTLMHDPAVIFLDEPTNGLDPRARVELRGLLRELAGKRGKTLMISSHILHELATISDSVGIIEEGKLVRSGSVADVMADVRQRRLLEVRVAGDAAGARRAIEAIDGLDVVGAETEHGQISVETDGDDEFLAGALKRLIDEGVAVVLFQEAPTDLETAFLGLTGGAQR